MSTHVSRGYSLIMLLLAVSCLSYTNAEKQVTKRQLKEIDRYLKKMNKPALKSIETPYGDIIDCVGIYNQPAFDNPLLKNHTIQMRPSSYPFGVNDDKEKVASEKGSTGSIFQPWRRYGQCPEDTVPIRRITRDDLLKRARSAGRFSRLSHRTGLYPTDVVDETAPPEHARAQLLGEGYRGANAVIDVWAPKVDYMDSSKSFITLSSGSGGDLNLIEAGWMVNQLIAVDVKPRLTVFFTNEHYNKSWCFNHLCDAFVQTSNKIALGDPIEPVSSYGGDRYAFYLAIYQDATTKDWWVAIEDDTVGYYPHNLFTKLRDGADSLFWGGTIADFRRNASSHTTTAMGSGHFPEENYLLASEIKNIQYLDSAWALQRPTKLDRNVHKPNCYNLTIGENFSGSSGAHLLYGGPGGNNPSCL